MAKHLATSRPSPKYNSTNLKSSLPGGCNSNHLVTPHIHTTECPTISVTSPKNNSISLKNYVFQETQTMNMQNVFPSATNICSFRTLFSVKLFYQLEELFLPKDLSNECAEQSSPVSPVNGHYKVIVPVSYCIDSMSSVSQKILTMNMQSSVFTSVAK